MNVSELLGKTLDKVYHINYEEVVFSTTDGEVYKLFHVQNCCEHVYLEDICGDLQDLVGSELVEAEEADQSDVNPEGVDMKGHCQDSFTWTFYKFRTAKGAVTLRWYGSSNGYYSESVEFAKL